MMGPGNFRQRQNLLLAVMPEATGYARKIVRKLDENYGRIRKSEAAVLAVAGGDRAGAQALYDSLKPFFPFLFDPDRSVCSRILDNRNTEQPALLVTDRFGTVWRRKTAAECGGPASLVDDALDELNFINLQCPECGVPDTPTPGG
jgi:peroxiredoxin